MQASNFSLRAGIYLIFESVELDLHNNYDFTSVEYNVVSQEIELVWQRAIGNWVSRDSPARVSLTFRGVTRFESIPGNASLPQSEHLCLSSFGYWTDEEWGQGQFWVDTAPQDNWAWSFQFQSGQEFRIQGETVIARAEPSSEAP